MAFYCSTVTFAAEADVHETKVESSSYANDFPNLPGPADGGPLVSHTNGYISGNVAHTYEFDIASFEDNRYFYLHIMTEGMVELTMYQNGVQVARVFANKTLTSQPQWVPIYHQGTANNVWARGDYTVKVKILFNYKYTFGICSSTSPL